MKFNVERLNAYKEKAEEKFNDLKVFWNKTWTPSAYTRDIETLFNIPIKDGKVLGDLTNVYGVNIKHIKARIEDLNDNYYHFIIQEKIWWLIFLLQFIIGLCGWLMAMKG